jgi:hypothetical protein
MSSMFKSHHQDKYITDEIINQLSSKLCLSIIKYNHTQKAFHMLTFLISSLVCILSTIGLLWLEEWQYTESLLLNITLLTMILVSTTIVYRGLLWTLLVKAVITRVNQLIPNTLGLSVSLTFFEQMIDVTYVIPFAISSCLCGIHYIMNVAILSIQYAESELTLAVFIFSLIYPIWITVVLCYLQGSTVRIETHRNNTILAMSLEELDSLIIENMSN